MAAGGDAATTSAAEEMAPGVRGSCMGGVVAVVGRAFEDEAGSVSVSVVSADASADVVVVVAALGGVLRAVVVLEAVVAAAAVVVGFDPVETGFGDGVKVLFTFSSIAIATR